MQINFGSYTGDGTSSRNITGVGFQPDLVLVKRADQDDTQFRTPDMAVNSSLPIRSDGGYNTDRVKALISDGFTIGSATVTNNNGSTFYWMAIKDNGAGDFTYGTYVGNATDGLAITGLGFQPDYVLTKANSSIVGGTKFVGTTNTSMQFGGDDRADLIVSLDADGFTVNNGSSSGGNLVNVNAVDHFFFAFKITTNAVSVFQYTGNGVDDRNITTPNFEAGWVHVKSTWGRDSRIRFDSQSGDLSFAWDGAQAVNGIQGPISTGFQLGTHISVNENGAPYNALVLAKTMPSGGGTAVKDLIGMGFIPFAR